MKNKDIEILKAIYHGNHLNEKERARAKELILILKQSEELR